MTEKSKVCTVFYAGYLAFLFLYGCVLIQLHIAVFDPADFAKDLTEDYGKDRGENEADE